MLSVVSAIAISAALGRRASLAPKSAIHVTADNAVSGNSASVAMAPTIHAGRGDAANAIVLAATFPAGIKSGQISALATLTRILLLEPAVTSSTGMQ
ncbi:MAG: hypothetical protein IT337_08295 [Thermomicrobiales bacterium]|nr:hypothetical protein [Thermomicrobiales bacterium]